MPPNWISFPLFWVPFPLLAPHAARTFPAFLRGERPGGRGWGGSPDNEISEDWSSLLAVWAYGNSEGDVAYHGKMRGTASLPLGATGEVRKIPVDAEGTTDILFSEYSLPNTLDTY